MRRPDSTTQLLEAIDKGDSLASLQLFERQASWLRRAAHGRLPAAARDRCDTADLVQETLCSVFARLRRFTSRRPGALRAYHASSAKLDAASFAQCLESGREAVRVLEDKQDAEALGVTATPATFVNGRLIAGARPLELFASVIEEELEQGPSTRVKSDQAEKAVPPPKAKKAPQGGPER